MGGGWGWSRMESDKQMAREKGKMLETNRKRGKRDPRQQLTTKGNDFMFWGCLSTHGSGINGLSPTKSVLPAVADWSHTFCHHSPYRSLVSPLANTLQILSPICRVPVCREPVCREPVCREPICREHVAGYMFAENTLPGTCLQRTSC